MRTALADTYIAIRTNFFGVVSIAQLVEMTDHVVLVLGSVVEVLSSNPAVGHKYSNIFQHLPAKLIYYISLYTCISVENVMRHSMK